MAGTRDDEKARSALPKLTSNDAHITDNVYDTYPEGGLRAWLCVCGGWCAMFAVYGLTNCLGLFLTYYVQGPLNSYSTGRVSWIITLQLYLQSASAILWGRLYDLYGPRWILLGGSVCYVFGLVMVSLSTKYYQLFLAQSIVVAVSSGAVFNVSLTCAATWFRQRRATAMGILVSGSSVGGVLLPIIFHKLEPRVGFSWTVRIIALFLLALCCISCITIKSRIPPRPRVVEFKDFIRPLREPAFFFTVVSGFFFLLGMFVPLNYIVLQAEASGIPSTLSTYLLSVINGSSAFGRIIPGFAADYLGRYNTMIAITGMCAVFTLALWIPSTTFASIVAYGVVFGFTSGGYVSIGAPCLAQISDIRELGTRTGIAYLLQAFGGLLGSPIAGAIVSSMHGSYLGLKIFCGVSMLVSAIFSLLARHAQYEATDTTEEAGLFQALSQLSDYPTAPHYNTLTGEETGSNLFPYGVKKQTLNALRDRMAQAETQYFDIKQHTFQDGTTVPSVSLAYLDINPTATKTALIVTCFRGRLHNTCTFAAGALKHYRVIVVALFGNGESSSPSNCVGFPKDVGYPDCVRAQHKLLVEGLNIHTIDVVVGFSMGGQTAYHWLLMYPEVIKSAVIICSSAKTSGHNRQFLEGPKGALENSVDYVPIESRTAATTPCRRGLRAFGKAYSAWLTSPEWFDEEKYKNLGFETQSAWDEVTTGANYKGWDADDLLVMLRMWQSCDVTALDKVESLGDTLAKINVPVLLMPCKSDQYFRWEASERESKMISGAIFRPIPSVWGHTGGSGVCKEDTQWMDGQISQFLGI